MQGTDWKVAGALRPQTFLTTCLGKLEDNLIEIPFGQAKGGDIAEMSEPELDFSKVESFLDSHPDLFEDYLIRKGKHHMVEKWLKRNQMSKTSSNSSADDKSKECWGNRGDGLQRRASQKELRKSFARSKAINVNRTYDEHVNSRAQEPLTSMRRRALLRKASSLPPTTAHILSALLESRVSIPQYPSTAIDYKYYLKEHNEREFFLELVKDISNELNLTSLCYKILIFVCIMVDADRCSLFLVEGTANKKSLVSKFFDVHAGTTLLPSYRMDNSNEVQVPWGKGIIGYVAEHGETVNIPDAYQVGSSLVGCGGEWTSFAGVATWAQCSNLNEVFDPCGIT